MWPFPLLQPRKLLRLVAIVGAGLLVPVWVAPALAQGQLAQGQLQAAIGALGASSAIAPRAEREKLAPAVMAPAVEAALQAEERAGQLAFAESVKRLREAEQSEPAYALAEYKRFFDERTLSAALGVQVGVKIAQMRLAMGDAAGALATCEVMAHKYADEPLVVLLQLQRARVLLEQKQLAQASECADEAMPGLLALGPSRYWEVSEALLQLVQANLDGGDAEGKERARALCVDLEEVYLRWIKQDTVDHLWQRFEVLQTDYQKAGDQKREDELLPKVGDVLLSMPIRKEHPEDVVLSLETARWLFQQGQVKQAEILYQRIPQFGDGWHTILARYDQAAPLIDAGKLDEAKALLAPPLNATLRQVEGEIAQNAWLASIEYQRGHLDEAFRLGQKVKEAVPPGQIPGGSIGNLYQWGLDIYTRAGGWKTQPIQTDTKEVVFKANPSQADRPLYARFRIKTYGDTSITAIVDNPGFQARVLPLDNWQREGLNAHEQEMEVVVTTSLNRPVADVPLVLSSAARGKTTTVRLSLSEESPRLALPTSG